MKKRSTVLVLIILIFLSACSKSAEPINSQMTPVEIVQKHFEYRANNDEKAYLTTFTESKLEEMNSKVPDNFAVKKIEITDIRLEEDGQYKTLYMRYGKGSVNHAPAEYISVVFVNFNVEYKNSTTNTHSWQFYLIRRNNDSPWLIDDWSEHNVLIY